MIECICVGMWFELFDGSLFKCQNPWSTGEYHRDNKDKNLNWAHLVPRVLRYKRGSDIIEGDIVEVLRCDCFQVDVLKTYEFKTHKQQRMPHSVRTSIFGFTRRSPTMLYIIDPKMPKGFEKPQNLLLHMFLSIEENTSQATYFAPWTDLKFWNSSIGTEVSQLKQVQTLGFRV